MDIVKELTSEDDKYACSVADKITKESNETNSWYKYFDNFASLLNHPKSYVINRVINILAANAKWDVDNHFDNIILDFLSHITDEKPITARQCIKVLSQIGKYKQKYIPTILSYLNNADLSKYKESIRHLIEKDIIETKKVFNNIE